MTNDREEQPCREDIKGGWLTLSPGVLSNPISPEDPAYPWVAEAYALRRALSVASEALRLTQGAMLADDERLDRAAARVWGENPHGCDAADWIAEEVIGLRLDVARLRHITEEAMGLLDAHTDAYWSDEAVALRNRLADGGLVTPAGAEPAVGSLLGADIQSEADGAVPGLAPEALLAKLRAMIPAAYREGYDDASDRSWCEKHLRRNSLGHVEAHSTEAADFFWKRSEAFRALGAHLGPTV